jgi:multidrug efflux pump subunit AcrA (membrane-fusion protein)
MVLLWVLPLCWQGCTRTPVVYPERKDIIETVYASGKIVSDKEYRLAALSSGTIIKKLVRDGDTVHKGQLLYIVNNKAVAERYHAALKNYQVATTNLTERSPLLNDLALSLQSASIKCTNDSLTYHRYNNLWAQHIGTKSNLDNVYATYTISQTQKKIALQKYNAALNDLAVSHSNARSQLVAAGKDLGDYFIRSDRDGVVYQTFKEAGEGVYINEVVALLGAPSGPLIRLAVDQQDINKIRTGQRVLVQTDVEGNTIYEAAVSFIYPVMNEQDQTFRVDAVFTKQGPPAFIHSSIEANIIIQKKEKALLLPRSVIAGNDSVWVRINNKKKKIGITTGITTLDYVEVTGGLTEKTPVLQTPDIDAK